MHIAILVTNTDSSAFARRHPGDGEKFQALLRPLREDWQYSVFAVKDGVFPDPDARFDGWIVTGSPASVHDGDLWIGTLLDLIRRLAADKAKVFGACFGHQAIAVALGGAVGDNPGGWVLGLTETEIGGEPIRLYAAHREQVLRLPLGAAGLGGNADCSIGGFGIGRHILTTQYHPEMTPEFFAALTEEISGKLPETVVTRARKSLSQQADRDPIAQRIVTFFEQP